MELPYSNDRILAAVRLLEEAGSCTVCFSGGLDSTVLADIAYRILGDRALAVTVDVPMMSDRQRDAASRVASCIGIRRVVVQAEPYDLDGILLNRHDRCYICKRAMYSAVSRVSAGRIVNGDIVDDLSEDRPGMAAGPEYGVSSPFLEAGVRRTDVVRYLDSMHLPIRLVKDTCMLMRYPEGMPVAPQDLRLVEDLEAEVRRISGLVQLRVRRTRDGFSVQTSTAELPVLEDSFQSVSDAFAERGLRAEINPVPYDKRRR